MATYKLGLDQAVQHLSQLVGLSCAQTVAEGILEFQEWIFESKINAHPEQLKILRGLAMNLEFLEDQPSAAGSGMVHFKVEIESALDQLRDKH